jgi:C4-dicarboxylate-specific signal transduction histidine kinase
MKDYVNIDKRKDELKKEKAFTTTNQKFEESFNQLKDQLLKSNDEKTIIKAQKFFKVTQELVDQYKNKLSITQELAGVGMAVEKSSHDIFMLIRKMIQNANDIVTKFEKNKLSTNTLRQFFADLTENLEFLYQEVQILQPLFRVARKTTKDISVREAVERVQRYYQREIRNNINFKIEGSDDLIVKTNLGLMLQIFINLTDNAIYWLNQGSIRKRAITVKIDATNNGVIFADNGPGIDEDLAEIVFSEFYSTKADGRGLGLYIVKELLDRINADISLITTDDFKVLPGANFFIKFNEAR